PSHVETRQTLVDNLLHAVLRALQGSLDLGFEKGAFGQRIEPEHIEKLAPDRGTFLFPILESSDVQQGPRGNLHGGLLQMFHHTLMPASAVFLAPNAGRNQQEEPDQSRRKGFHHRDSFSSDALQVRNSFNTSSREQRSR